MIDECSRDHSNVQYHSEVITIVALYFIYIYYSVKRWFLEYDVQRLEEDF